MVIQTSALTKMYNGVNVVNGVNLSIEQGEIFGLLGKNGAGKSTLIGMLTGFVIPTSGAISLFDRPYSEMNRVKARMGVLPDTSNYYQDLNAVQHLNYLGALLGVRSSREELVHQLEQVGLKGHEFKKIRGFSFGMKKKLGIAQALLGRPELIILDEPTSGLDPESAQEIQQLVMSCASQGRTIMLTSHNLHEIEKICTKVAIMDKGQIACSGTMRELREHFQSEIKLSIALNPFTPEQEQLLKRKLAPLAAELHLSSGRMTAVLTEEAVIPQLVALLVQEQMQVFRVEVEQKSLEQIFFETGA
ncbi:ABC transporter ATP-binding protein [Paenibacillus sp. y28]|uniref:ABC transporter ATP-binding protein n=1 Tax=Paenibacillus sp. y28 TaxID=3129110 RepID=UPI00301906AB